VRHSVAMPGAIAHELWEHLLRADGQEDVTLATYRPSTGVERQSYLIRTVHPPRPGERDVHGNASFTGDYVLRVASAAFGDGSGVAILHSHPGGRGWQGRSAPDADAERSYAHLVHEITGLPLLGMTLAGGDRRWSARRWSPTGEPTWCESVRVIDDILHISWNDALRQPPPLRETQVRTASGWGPKIQADIARLCVLVIGAGSIGLEVALRLAASGIQHVAVMDFDTVELLNLDRLIGATRLDALLRRPKADVAVRLLRQAATAAQPDIRGIDYSICEPRGHEFALDYDVIFSCVDRPWPRAVLNMTAYADLIPVIDGGLHIDPFPDGGMRNATWRSHVVRPGRPCLACIRQLDLGQVAMDREGLLDDPEYIRRAGQARAPARQNVATLSVSVVSSVLAQFVSFVAGPGGRGEPGPLQYLLTTHSLSHLPYTTQPNCYFESATAAGDQRLALTGTHRTAEEARDSRTQTSWQARMISLAATAVQALDERIERCAIRSLRSRSKDPSRLRSVAAEDGGPAGLHE
jgi:molybdopterin-synthase adenylyltransferase